VPNTTALNTSAKIAVSSLLLSYPEFTTVSEFYNPASTVHFNGLTARLQKRISKGLEMNANFEWSRQIGATVMTNPGVFWVGETSSDYPVHLAVTSIYELPIGHGRQFMSNTKRVVDAALGGWKVSGEYQFLSGPPISWGKVYYKGNFHDFNNSPHNTAAAFNTANFDRVPADQPGTWNLRTFPQYLLRSDPTNNFNFSALKDFVMFERLILTARVDAFNALNHAQMGGQCYANFFHLWPDLFASQHAPHIGRRTASSLLVPSLFRPGATEKPEFDCAIVSESPGSLGSPDSCRRTPGARSGPDSRSRSAPGRKL
jgi:hypothetical protein